MDNDTYIFLLFKTNPLFSTPQTVHYPKSIKFPPAGKLKMTEVVCKSNIFSLCDNTKYHLQKRYRAANLSFRSNTCFYGRRVVVAPSNPAYVVSTRRKASNIQVCYF